MLLILWLQAFICREEYPFDRSMGFVILKSISQMLALRDRYFYKNNQLKIKAEELFLPLKKGVFIRRSISIRMGIISPSY